VPSGGNEEDVDVAVHSSRSVGQLVVCCRRVEASPSCMNEPYPEWSALRCEWELRFCTAL
jgi:hypothetical protein